MSPNARFHEIEPHDPPLGLTEKERTFYDFLKAFVGDEGRWPTYRETCQAFGWKSENSVTQMYKQLYEKGWIERHGVGEWRFKVGRCPYCGSALEEHPSSSG
jgi:hypothetical protein